VREGAEFLKQKLELAGASWSRSSMPEFEPPSEEPAEAERALNLLQVLRLAQQALAAARAYSLVTPADPVTVEEMIAWLEQLMATGGDMEARALLEEQPDPPHRMALFLAMLEMAKGARIELAQSDCFGPIALLDRRPPFWNPTT
jgi:chromatin segregation and condensation protein Rec8/ScpA/Scc1 (kleisin family)